MTDQSIDSTPEITRHIAKRLGDEGLSLEQIGSVLAAWNEVRNGDPVGMVRRDPESGSVAHRVDAEGVHLWRVSETNGEQYNDAQPTLAWPVLYTPDE